jgi:Kef-type K+ transport system membrane component KefB
VAGVRGNEDRLELSGEGASSGARLLTILLTLLGALGLPLILLAGDDLEAQPEIAGRYQVTQGTACLGTDFDLRQSGRFLSLSRPDGERIGRPRLEDGRVTGTLGCLDGSSAELDAQLKAAEIEGTLAGVAFDAERVRTYDATDDRNAVDPGSLDGSYLLSPESSCLGRTMELDGDAAPILTLSNGTEGELRYADGQLSGGTMCLDGDPVSVQGVPTGDRLELEITRAAPEAGEQIVEQAVAERDESLGDRVAAFFLAAAIVLLAARLCGLIARRFGQPQVMGEIVAGILLGPTLFGAVLPEVQADLFSAEVLPVLGIVANLGLAIYLFSVGSELDGYALRGRTSQLAAVAAAGFVVPFLLGAGVALAIYEPLAPDVTFEPFALFMGVALAITAFPVLARILEERGMLGTPIGATALACAAIDDVLGWLLVTVAAALAVAGTAREVLPTVLWTLAFGLLLWFVARPLLRRLAAGYDRTEPNGSGDGVGSARSAIVALVYVLVLLSAWATERIGIALIIGAVALGAVMPKDASLTEDMRRRSESFVSLILLPLFFAYAGLRTDVGLLGEPELWLTAILLFGLAVVGKLVATALAARISGFGWRDAGILGTLMNTRGLTELIILTLGLELCVISEALFTALVLMALVTTFMAGPLLSALEPRRRVSGS